MSSLYTDHVLYIYKIGKWKGAWIFISKLIKIGHCMYIVTKKQVYIIQSNIHNYEVNNLFGTPFF